MNLPLSDMIFLLLVGTLGGAILMFFVMRAYGRQVTKVIYQDLETQNRQVKRVKKIEKWASDKMNTVPQRLQTMDRMILVPYGELLNVWDTCDKIYWEL